MHASRSGLSSRSLTWVATVLLTLATVSGCAKHDASTPATTADSASASHALDSASTAPAAVASTAPPTDITPVRGAVASVSDSVLVVTTAKGDVHVALDAPVHVYQRANSDLAHVTAKSFVGVTSVKQADGSQVATEIHIFPEDLRGTGEGSYLMTPPGAKDSSGSRSTMTNGTVAAKPVATEAPRMTNGAVASRNGQTMTVDYHGGSQTINVPAGVSVTSLEAATAKLAKGAKVIVLGKKQADGSLRASSVILAPPAAPPAK
jgi:hypothetical protein